MIDFQSFIYIHINNFFYGLKYTFYKFEIIEIRRILE